MRLFSWFGAAALAAAAGFGYVAGTNNRPCTEQSCPMPTPNHEEEASAPPGLAFDWRRPFVEDIDLTCPPNLFWNFDLTVQTPEPPTAPSQLDPAIRQTSFELPAGDATEQRPFMPYCDEESEAMATPTRPRYLARALMNLRRILHDDQ